MLNVQNAVTVCFPRRVGRYERSFFERCCI